MVIKIGRDSHEEKPVVVYEDGIVYERAPTPADMVAIWTINLTDAKTDVRRALENLASAKEWERTCEAVFEAVVAYAKKEDENAEG